MALKVGANPVQNFDSVKSLDTPSIACGDPAVVGSYNCLLAWSAADLWEHLVKWRQCYISTSAPVGDLICGGNMVHSYRTSAGPSVAYVGTGTYPWQIAISQGGATIYTWRKRATDNYPFVDQRLITYNPRTIAPALGSSSYSPDDRRYIFTLFE